MALDIIATALLPFACRHSLCLALLCHCVTSRPPSIRQLTHQTVKLGSFDQSFTKVPYSSGIRNNHPNNRSL